MAAPTEVPPLPHIDRAPLFFGFNEPPLQPPFMTTPLSNDVQNAGQNYDRSHEPDVPLPPPPQLQTTTDVTAPQDPIPPPIPQTGNEETERRSTETERNTESEDGSDSEHGDSEAEDEQPAPQHRWQPIEEDKTAPCDDELAYITSKGEHSALDYDYWEKKTFFDLEDPEITMGASGRIDWLVERFNGTRENPNKELIMRSPIMSIGGYDWRIKFYPKGNISDYLSVYLECVTIQSEDFKESVEFSEPTLPSLSTQERPKQRAIVAAQVAVVMYNPAEPRVYEYQCDAHQFTKKSSDYGWTRFTRYSRHEFKYRSHGQRQAILRDDKLAFSAYIRIVNDPTKCMWAHGSDHFLDSIALTGLRPFAWMNPMFAAKIPLLHFAPFRKFLYKCKDTKIVFWLQSLLWKMLTRTRSQSYGAPVASGQADAIAWLRYVAFCLRNETDAGAIVELLGTFDPDNGAAVGRNKLKTKVLPSVQAAIDDHKTAIATPVLLTLELEREEFDRTSRKWDRITNKVEIQNRIVIAGKPYLLYAFSTHIGELTSNRFNVYVRPNGSDGLWYAYTDSKVTALTHKQAVDQHCGWNEPSSPSKDLRISPPRLRKSRFEEWNEVAHVVFYVREDYQDSLTSQSITEDWEVPDNVKLGKPPKEILDVPEPPPTAFDKDHFETEQAKEIDAHIERAHQNSVELAGAATPSSWLMDGEDIVMGEADAEAATEAAKDAAAEKYIADCTIECFGRDYYKGSTLAGVYHGEGHLISKNGDEYIGSFVAGQKCGHGKMVYAQSGNTYEGQWLEDQHHGEGKLTEAKTGNVFEGGWKQGKKSGAFVLKGTVTDEDKGCCSICYDKEINTAFYDCGHVLACRNCAQKIDVCPVCRKRVLARLELFGVKMILD